MFKRSNIKSFLRLIFFSYLFCAKSAHAHPVSFEGGFSLMSEMSRKNQEVSIIYSAKYWLGSGLVFIKSSEKPAIISAQAGLLVKRWNLPEAQGNFYFFGALGFGGFMEKKTRLIYRLGAQLDYETRRVYTFMRYAENRFFKNNQQRDDELSAAVGFAPYLAEFDELNSWLIFKIVMRDRLNERSYMPLLRFFYKNFLWEIGQSFNGDSQFNFMIRF